ncbi:MAG: DUF4968 domain-containing protein [Spirochaetes bacterium]|nr:DUF4968 domain-containing protein [Spirochaetota bacterium]
MNTRDKVETIEELTQKVNALHKDMLVSIDEGKAIRNFLKTLLKYPLSTFRKKTFSEGQPNVYYSLTDHPLDRGAVPYQTAITALTAHRNKRSACVLSLALRERQGNSFLFDAPGYDIFKVLWRDAPGIQHTYRYDRKTRYRPLSLRLDFLREDAYRLRLAPGNSVPEHRTPMIAGDIGDETLSLSFDDRGTHYRIASRRIELKIYKSDFRIEVFDSSGAIIAETGSRTKTEFANAFDSFPLGFIDEKRSKKRYGVESFTLFPGEAVYGFGERFDTVNHVGKTIGLWSFEGSGNASGRVYKPVPFFMSTRGYGVFINTTNPVTCWIGTRESCTNQIAVEGGGMDYYFFYGPSLKSVLNAYTDLTGKPPVLPRWSFGTWMSRWSYFTQEQVLQVGRLLRKMKMPCDVIHIDAGWFKSGWACDWRFDRDRFPDPEGMFAELRAMGFHASLWQCPYALEETGRLGEARKKKILPKMKGPFVWLYMYPGSPIDFSNPDGVAWYKERLAEVLRKGASAIKADFGEQIDPHMKFREYDGIAMHNLYPLLYNRAAFEAVQETTGEGIIWARSAWAGSQRYPVHWSGDNSANYPNILTCLRSALSLGLCGFTYWSQDTGGFAGNTTDELYVRWTQASLFQSHIRYHAPLPTFNEPWNVSKETQDEVRKLLELRYRLIPYLFSEAARSAAAGLPLLRHLVLEFQEDPTVYTIEDQFMCGERIMIAPIMTQDHRRRVYLPGGVWYDFFTGRKLDGPRWIEVKGTLKTFPVYARGGAIIPMAKPVRHTGELSTRGMTLKVYPDETGQAGFVLHDEKRKIRIAAAIAGRKVKVSCAPRLEDPKVELPAGRKGLSAILQ